ncbi:hypothetical protein OIV83_005711 [Microbotryomycetes sp. JL201]|nr:hypothetical protein OIV83_005711 [Microbotryomycetes sp. JL201]
MAPPRASRLATRKSIVADPALYNVAMSDSDEDDRDARATRRADDNNKTNPPNKRRKSDLARDTTAAASLTATGHPAATNKRASATPSRVQQQHQDQPATASKRRRAPHTHQSATTAATSATSDRSHGTTLHGQGTPKRGEAVQAPSTNIAASAGKPSRRRNDTSTLNTTLETSAAGSSTQAITDDDQRAPPTKRTRSGFKPRAVPSRANRAAEAHKADNPLTPADNLSFAFATNPPTPRDLKRQVQPDNGAKVRQSPRSKKRSRDDLLPQNAPQQDQSSSPLSSPRPRARSASAPIHANETPVQLRNIAFRQGDTAQGSAGRQGGRTSAKGSGRRGSSIGGGFEAVPHPLVPDNLLYRSTDATEPVARRLRSILSWTTQRRRDQLQLESKSSQDTDVALAFEVIGQFISDVCDSRIDVSVQHSGDDARAAIGDRRRPHPRNESNAAKLAEIEANYAAISREQDARDSVKPTYEAFARRAEARTLAMTAADVMVDFAAVDGGLPNANITAYEDALAFGRQVLDSSSNPTDAKGKKGANRKSRPSPEEALVSTELSKLLADVRLDTAHFRQLSHRLDKFVEVTSSYVSSRSRGTHRALTTQAQQGAQAHGGITHLPPVGDDHDDSSVRMGIASAVSAGAHTANAATGAGSEQRDLLRALAAADTRARR